MQAARLLCGSSLDICSWLLWKLILRSRWLQVIVSCGYWDNSIRCYNVDDGRLLQSLRQHKDIVTCVSLGSDGCTLVSGQPWPACLASGQT